VCLYIHESIDEGVHILETNSDGFIWVKFCKTFLRLDDDLYICFVYIPPHDSAYFKAHESGFFLKF
ncbi:MAG: hypothetical protein N0E48_14605, partial [Candidatus Thiodiazotropha endolucinida]|nr:hypothetical protein [Candidatus Thiodiazotropha taylori]MCW4344565.1 hypothetical protein [Candidatus Thiodiazotropha endolucinida]